MVAVRLLARGRTRAGWAAVGLLCLSFAGAGLWVTIASPMRFPGHLVSIALGTLYLWLGLAAVDLARDVGALRVSQDVMHIEHPSLLAAPMTLVRAQVVAVALDDRPAEDRRVAAAARRRVVAPPSFLDLSIPVVGSAPSSHSAYGVAAAPNLVLFFSSPATSPGASRAVRTLLKLSGGRTGKYRGPRAGQPMDAVRLCLEDPAAARALLATWGAGEVLDRDRSYLAPIRARDRRKAARERLIMTAIVIGAGVVIPLLLWFGERSA